MFLRQWLRFLAGMFKTAWRELALPSLHQRPQGSLPLSMKGCVVEACCSQEILERGGINGVRIHSFEVRRGSWGMEIHLFLWQLWENGTMVAGEMGYSVGGCYTR